MPPKQEMVRKTFTVAQSYSGPLPQAQELEKYKEIYPESVKIIFDIFQKQSEHRMDLERKVIEANNRRSDRGQLFAFMIALIIIGIAVYFILTGKSITGFGIIIGEISVLAGVFLYGKSAEKKERKERLTPINNQ